jgi:hypothetical protein
MIKEGAFSRGGLENSAAYEQLAADARRFLLAQGWCPGVRCVYFAEGFEHVAVFYCELVTSPGNPTDCWVVIGDLPPAYLSTELCKTAIEALIGYVTEMLNVVDAFEKGDDVSELIPLLTKDTFLPLELTPDVMYMLADRLRFILTRVLPLFPDELLAAGYDPADFPLET